MTVVLRGLDGMGVPRHYHRCWRCLHSVVERPLEQDLAEQLEMDL